MLRTPHRVTLLPYTTLFRSNTAGLIGYRAFGDAPRTGFPDQAGAGASALLGRYGVYAVQPTGGGALAVSRYEWSPETHGAADIVWLTGRFTATAKKPDRRAVGE